MEAPLVNWMETGTTILCTELDWLNGVAGSKSMDKALSGHGQHAEPPHGSWKATFPIPWLLSRAQLQLYWPSIVYLMLAEV